MDHTASIVGDHIYVIGGVNHQGKLIRDVGVFSFSGGQVLSKKLGEESKCPVRLIGHTACVVNDRYIYVFGGGDGRTPSNSLLIFDTKYLRWSTPEVGGKPPSPRAKHSAVVYQSVSRQWMVVFGGVATFKDKYTYTNDIYVLEFVSNGTLRWMAPKIFTPETDPPKPRMGHSAWVYENYMVIFGGLGSKHEVLDDVIVVDLGSQELEVRNISLSATTDDPQPRANHAISPVFQGSDRFFVIIGGMAKKDVAVSDCFVFDCLFMRQYPIELQGKPLYPLSRHILLSFNQKFYIYGGMVDTRASNMMFMLILDKTHLPPGYSGEHMLPSVYSNQSPPIPLPFQNISQQDSNINPYVPSLKSTQSMRTPQGQTNQSFGGNRSRTHSAAVLQQKPQFQ
eukprot:c16789_g1_i1.p1 GENE.c16789_g1_i1~~c16789_g1_i1.p1  ORF type:complete len:460 (+),score=223.74 c16789_g1_i1:196-1380(+)